MNLLAPAASRAPAAPVVPLARAALAALAALALLACRRPPVVPARPVPPVALRPGLEYRETSCLVGAHGLHVRSLHAAAGAGLELRALRNPTSHTDARCQNRYAGVDVRQLAGTLPGFSVLGATNGNFFHRLPGGTFRSNGMIWTATDAPDGALLAPIQPTVDPDFRGDHVFVADAAGGHEVRIASGPCTPGACRVTVSPLPGTPAAAWDVLRARPQPMGDGEFVAALRAAFPGATLAMQLNHALSDAAGDRAAAPEQVLAEAFRCGPAHAWTCQPHAVTLLCAHPDGAVSLMTSEPAAYADLAAGLRVGGACATECALLYLLDGGGSAQIGYADRASGAFRVTYAGKQDPVPPPGCAEYRPVEHYLVVGTGAATRDP